MKVDHLFLGIGRGDRNDFKELYRLTRQEVYALALSYVKDRHLAEEILTETYKRVWMYAFSYNSDMDGELWLLDIACNLSQNALLDRKLRRDSEKKLSDNISKLLIDIIQGLSGDRGKVIMMSLLSDVSVSGLSSLLGYSQGALKREYREGIKELEKKDAFYRTLDIPATVRDNFPECVPDVWSRINKDEPTALAYTSHELLDLDPEDYAFGDTPQDAPGDDKTREDIEKLKKKKKLKIIITLCVIASAVLIAAGIITGVVINRKAAAERKTYTEYFGTPQFNTKLQVETYGDLVFYSDPSEDHNMYMAKIGDNITAVRLGDIRSKDFTFDGKYLYYRSETDGSIRRALIGDAGVSEDIAFGDRPGSILTLSGDKLYFSGISGIYSMPLSGGESELVYDCTTDENLQRYDMEASSRGNLFFSAGVWKGIHYLTDYKGTVSIDTLFIDEAYKLRSAGDRLYFFFRGIDESFICYFDEDELDSKTPHYVENINTGTGAFFVYDGYIYYEGYSDAEGKNSGIFRVSEAGGDPEMLFKYDTSKGSYISDLCVCEKGILCFYSTGKKNGSLRFELRSLTQPEKVLYTFFD